MGIVICLFINPPKNKKNKKFIDETNWNESKIITFSVRQLFPLYSASNKQFKDNKGL